MKSLKIAMLIVIAFALPFIAWGQSYNEEHFKDLKFRNIGPAGMSGRVTAIDVDLSNDNRIFAGTASGGLWLSEDGGTSWKPLFDKQSNLSIGAVKINQNNPDEIWVGTGEGNPRNSLNTGNGIYKSIDGGKTWQHLGLDNTKTIHRIIIDRDNPNIVYAACPGAPWGPTPDRGVYKTTDGGKSWKKILYVNENTGAADMVVDPANPNKILVAMWEHGRKPWFFNSGGEGSGLYLTYDGGDNWKKISDKEGLPKGDLGRIGIAIAANKPNIIYALIEAKENGLYKSTDGGEKWKLVSKENIGNRPFYYAELYVDPSNENRIFNIYTYVSKSEDGGRTFETIMDYGNNLHPDHHAFWIHPTNPQYMIDGNDGGMAISRDGGSNWTFVTNLPVGQFYHVNIDDDFPYNIYGGMQDNGSWAGPSSVFKSGGIRNYDFREISFGDGFDVVPFRKDSRYGYSMSQGGYVGFYDRETGDTKYVRPIHPDSTELRFNWNAAIAQDPFADCGAYFGSQFVHYTKDCGHTWQIISPDLTTNDTSKQKYDTSGGLTMDATGAENHTTILAIAPSTFDKNTIWVGTDDGNLQITRDGGQSWTNITKSLPGAPKNGWIPQIEVSPHQDGEAFVIVNNYRQNDYRPYLYHTTDFGKTWRSLVTSDLTTFTLSIVQDPEVPELLFLGADNGLFISFDKGKKWHHITEAMPQVQVADMKIHRKNRDLVIGTFGRSIWVVDDIDVWRSIARDRGTLDKEFQLFSIPDAYDVSYRSVDGVRFIGQGEFVGDNDNNRGAMISMWVKPQDMNKKDEKKEDKKAKEKKEEEKSKDKDSSNKKDKSKKSKDKVYFTILNEAGDTIRNFSRKVETGFVRTFWYLEEDGIEYPSKRKSDDDADPPSGGTVLPGQYKVIATYNDHTDSSMVNVAYDPRIDYQSKDIQAAKAFRATSQQIVEEATKAYELLKGAKAGIKRVETVLEEQPDSIAQHFKDLHKQFNKYIDSLELLVFGPSNEKGITRNPDNLTSYLYGMNRYEVKANSTPSSNAYIAQAKAKSKTTEFVKAVNAFFDDTWQKYQEDAASIRPILFKALEEVKD